MPFTAPITSHRQAALTLPVSRVLTVDLSLALLVLAILLVLVQ